MEKPVSKKCDIIVKGEECKLIEALRSISYGEVTAFVQNNQLVRIEIKKSIKI